MLIDLLSQYKGKNNGDLVAAFSILRNRGWRSKETIRNALLELIYYGWIVVTRRGGLNKICNLYAITFNAIDECAGKIDLPPTNAAPGNWKQTVEKWQKPIRLKKTSVRDAYLLGTKYVPITAKGGQF